MNTDELKGRPVITIEGGEKMGQVSDAVFDLGQRRLVALLVSSGGLIGGSKHTIEVGAIHRIGPDAITVQSRGKLREGEHVPDGFVRLSDLRKRAVITESGQELGALADLHLSDDYAVTEVEMSTGSGLLGMFGSAKTFAVAMVVAFGDVITVKDELLSEARKD